MQAGPVKSWVDRVLEMAVALVVIGLLLQWAWQLLRPLVPIVIGALGALVVGRLLLQRYRSW